MEVLISYDFPRIKGILMGKERAKILVILSFLAAELILSCQTGSPGKGSCKINTFPKEFNKWERIQTHALYRKNHDFFKYNEIYVNQLGYAYVGEGGYFPEGTIWVRADYELQDDGSHITRGKPSGFYVMKKVKGKEETGGWLYEEYDRKGNPRPLGDTLRECHNCHKSMETQDYIFSKFH